MPDQPRSGKPLSSRQLAELLDVLPEALLWVDSAGEVRWRNRAAENLAKLSPANSHGVGTRDLTDAELLRSLLSKIGTELELLDADGQRRMLDVSTWPAGSGQDGSSSALIRLVEGSGRRQARQLAHAANNALGAARGQCEITQIKHPGEAEIVQRMKQAIDSIDEVSKLLRQTVRLGLLHPATSAQETSPSIARLLLLARDPTLRVATADLLRALGYTVQAVADPDALLQLVYDEESPADVLLGEASAISAGLIEQLRRSRPALRYLLLCSDSALAPSFPRCASIAKPFTAASLNTALERLLAN